MLPHAHQNAQSPDDVAPLGRNSTSDHATDVDELYHEHACGHAPFYRNALIGRACDACQFCREHAYDPAPFLQEFVLALNADGRFARVETAETMLRGWNVSRRSVRPAHRMVAHSGFITTAVRCVPPGREGYASRP